MSPHAFIAPFGTKPAADGQPIDFNRIYAELLRPALELAGFDVFRADDEQRAGDLRTDMLQELLAADLVLADLTLDNSNVWYELGVRHALRARRDTGARPARASRSTSTPTASCAIPRKTAHPTPRACRRKSSAWPRWQKRRWRRPAQARSARSTRC